MPKNKLCFVPCCKSTSVATPNKIFISVPTEPSRKRKWFRMARLDTPKSNTVYFCCEDHFNLEEDMENFVRYKLLGGRITMKENVVPHIFDCQTDRKTAFSIPDRELITKLKRKRLVDEAIADSNKKHQLNLPSVSNVNEPSTSAVVNETESTTLGDMTVTTLAVLDTTAVPPQTRSVAVQAKPSFCNKYISCNIKSSVQDSSTSPIQTKHSLVKRISFSQMSSSSEIESLKSSSFVVSTTDSDFNEDKIPQDKKDEQFEILKSTRLLIKSRPKAYTGIPDHWFPHMINLFSVKYKISEDNLMLTLMKIKANDSFVRLGDIFGMSTSNASKIFKKTVVQIEPHLKHFIFWPSKEKIKYYLPIAFRAHYSNVQSIIDCLEIEIQKPTDPIKQALTWSEYKKCNTLKYLISSTPDGFINFISKGYGGRISDSLLVQDSGYLEILPSGCSVMADRGFKDLAKQLHDKNCQLIRPPSVSSAVIPTKMEVLETKRIASLRIHIERVIRRLREFHYLKPHSVIDHNLIPSTDLVIEIACALINLQSSIIKQV